MVADEIINCVQPLILYVPNYKPQQLSIHQIPYHICLWHFWFIHYWLKFQEATIVCLYYLSFSYCMDTLFGMLNFIYVCACKEFVWAHMCMYLYPCMYISPEAVCCGLGDGPWVVSMWLQSFKVGKVRSYRSLLTVYVCTLSTLVGIASLYVWFLL